MMVNPATKTFPRKHRQTGYFELENVTTQNETMIPILACDANLTNPEDFHTNPTHPSYGGVTDSPNCYPGSRVDNFLMELVIAMPKAAADLVPGVRFQTMYVCNAFKDLDEQSDTFGSDLKTLLRLEKTVADDSVVHPWWNGTKMTNASLLGSLVDDLTTDQTMEGINFDEDSYREEIISGSARGLLKKMTPGGLKDWIVYGDRPYAEKAWHQVPGYVKRMNQFTTFNLMFRLPLEGIWKQFWHTELTAQSPLRIGYSIYYNEKHDMFDSD